MTLSRSWVLSCGVAASVIILAHPAAAASFTIIDGQTVTVTQTLNTAGDVGTVQQGGSILPNGAGLVFGIQATADNVTINNAGTVHPTSTGVSVGISIKNNSIVNNTGVVDGEYGISVDNGSHNTIINSGTVYGVVNVLGSHNTITNSGTVERFGGAAVFTTYNATITNSGTVIARNSGPGVDVFDSNVITNSGTIQGVDSGIEAYSNNTIINSGKLVGGNAAVFFRNTNNTLELLRGSNIEGVLRLGDISNRLVIQSGIDTAFAFTGTPTFDTNGVPYVIGNATPLISDGTLYVVNPTGFSAADEMAADLTGIVTGAVDERLVASRSGGGAGSVAMNGMVITAVADVPGDYATMAWAKVLGNYRDQKADGNDVGFENLLGGLVVGVDSPMGESARGGLFIGAATGRMQSDGNSQTIDSDNYFGGLYGSFNGSGHFLDMSLTAGLADFDSDRRVANNLVVGGIEHAEADYQAFFISPSITLGSAIHMDSGGIFTPSVRARYAGLFLDSYDESGSAANLSVDSRNVHVFEVRGQLAFGLAPLQQEGGVLNTTLRLGVDGIFSDGDDVDAVLAGTPLSFNAGNSDETARGFAGLDLLYTTNGGSSLHLGGEAGYDSNDSLSLQAAVGFEIPL